MRLKPLVRELARLARATERLATVEEARALKEFAYVPPPDRTLTTEEREVYVTYTDEEVDAVREFREKLGKIAPEEVENE
jgi:hypothetical protein